MDITDPVAKARRAPSEKTGPAPTVVRDAKKGEVWATLGCEIAFAEMDGGADKSLHQCGLHPAAFRVQS